MVTVHHGNRQRMSPVAPAAGGIRPLVVNGQTDQSELTSGEPAKQLIGREAGTWSRSCWTTLTWPRPGPGPSSLSSWLSFTCSQDNQSQTRFINGQEELQFLLLFIRETEVNLINVSYRRFGRCARFGGFHQISSCRTNKTTEERRLMDHMFYISFVTWNCFTWIFVISKSEAFTLSSASVKV